MPVSANAIRLTRVTHLYLGVFIAPALLFFAFTGALQTFGLHETTRGSAYKPYRWIATLGQIHKKQTWLIPIRKPPAPEAVPQPRPIQARPAAPAPATQPPGAPQKSHIPLKIFFLLVSLGLFTSTLTGIAMAYMYNRNKWVVTALLVAGTVIPILCLPF